MNFSSQLEVGYSSDGNGNGFQELGTRLGRTRYTLGNSGSQSRQRECVTLCGEGLRSFEGLDGVKDLVTAEALLVVRDQMVVKEQVIVKNYVVVKDQMVVKGLVVIKDYVVVKDSRVVKDQDLGGCEGLCR